MLPSSPGRLVEDDSSSKISSASRPRAGSSGQLGAPPPPPLARPLSRARGARRPPVIPDAGASLPLALFASGLGGGDSERKARGERGLAVRRRRLLWGAGSSEAASSSGSGGSSEQTREPALKPAGCAVIWAADWDLAPPSPASCCRSPPPGSPPPPASPRSGGGCVRAPSASARGSSPGERAAGTAAAVAGWPARPGLELPERKTTGKTPAGAVDRRWRQGCVGFLA